MAIKFKTEDCHYCGGSGRQPAEDSRLTLRAAREKAGISLRTLSAAMGISLAYLSDIELGNRKLSGRIATLYTEKLHALSGGVK